jgi:hypothetical protein
LFHVFLNIPNQHSDEKTAYGNSIWHIRHYTTTRRSNVMVVAFIV